MKNPSVFPFDIKERVILITGAAGLLGNNYSLFLASKGASLALVDVNINKLKRLKAEIEKCYQVDCLAIKADISSEKDVKAMIKKVISHFKRVDVLINNAGISGRFSDKPVKFEDYSLRQWQKAMDVNITGMFLCCREVVKHMLTQGAYYCSIINISSTYGLDGPDQRIYRNGNKQTFIKPVSYSVSKGAVIILTKYLAAYLNKTHIRVNTLTPGGVQEDSQTKEFIKNYSKKTIMGRMAEPYEYNGAILFLASDASKYMTGANLVIDGGWTAW